MQTEDAYRLRDALADYGVEYMIIGKVALILQGFPGTTQDIDIFPSKDPGNPEKLLDALKSLGFEFNLNIGVSLHHSSEEVLRGKDFVQLKNGPFQLDIVYAPDGIESLSGSEKVQEDCGGVSHYRCRWGNPDEESHRTRQGQRGTSPNPALPRALTEKRTW